MASGVDCGKGPSWICEKTQCDLLCQEFEYQHIDLGNELLEKSGDQTYPHAAFVKECLEEKVDIPRELKISLIDGQINKGAEEGKQWSLVHGFPGSIEDLLGFEEKVGLTRVE